MVFLGREQQKFVVSQRGTKIFLWRSLAHISWKIRLLLEKKEEESVYFLWKQLSFFLNAELNSPTSELSQQIVHLQSNNHLTTRQYQKFLDIPVTHLFYSSKCLSIIAKIIASVSSKILEIYQQIEYPNLWRTMKEYQHDE